MMTGLTTYCLNCKYKIPCWCQEMEFYLIEHPCVRCGKLKVVNQKIWLLFNQYSNIDCDEFLKDKQINIIDSSDFLTTYSTAGTDQSLTAMQMMDAINSLKPLSREFKRTELKTEFLKNRWSW